MPCPSCKAAELHPGCEGSGFLVSSDEQCPQAVAFRASQKRAKRLGECGIPERYREATVAGYLVGQSAQRDAAKRACIEYVQGFGLKGPGNTTHGLFLFGDVGAGKTMLAAACLRAVVGLYGATGRFAHLPALADSLRERIGKELPSHDLLEPLFAADLVVLDELSAQKMTPWWEERLSLIVGERYSRALPTIVTSELGLEELRGRMPERVLSRLWEMSLPVDLRGAGDFRRRDPKDRSPG